MHAIHICTMNILKLYSKQHWSMHHCEVSLLSTQALSSFKVSNQPNGFWLQSCSAESFLRRPQAFYMKPAQHIWNLPSLQRDFCFLLCRPVSFIYSRCFISITDCNINGTETCWPGVVHGVMWGMGHCSNGQYIRCLPEAKQINNTFGYQGYTCVHGNTVSSSVVSVSHPLFSLAPSIPASRCLPASESVCDSFMEVWM